MITIDCHNCGQQISGKATVCKTCKHSFHSFCTQQCKSCGAALCDVHYELGNGHCEECAPKEKELNVIRRSNIELYRTCPYAFYKMVMLGFKQFPSIPAIVGNVLHDLFEDESMKRTFLEDEMYTTYIKMMEKEIENNKDLFTDWNEEKFYLKGKDCIKNFIDYERTHSKPVGVEVPIKFEIDSTLPKVSIIIDRVEDDDGKLRIIDYKTGKIFAGKKLKEDLQVPLYILGAREKYGRLPDEFEFLFLDENKVRTYTKINDDEYKCTVRKNEYIISLTETIREIKTIFGRIKQRSFSIPSKVNTFYCRNFCDVYKHGECAGGIDERWKLMRQSKP